MISRRGFLGGLLAVAAVEAIPFNRVWFLPKQVVIPETFTSYLIGLNAIYYDKLFLDSIKTQTVFIMLDTAREFPTHTGKKIYLFSYQLPSGVAA